MRKSLDEMQIKFQVQEANYEYDDIMQLLEFISLITNSYQLVLTTFLPLIPPSPLSFSPDSNYVTLISYFHEDCIINT